MLHQYYVLDRYFLYTIYIYIMHAIPFLRSFPRKSNQSFSTYNTSLFSLVEDWAKFFPPPPKKKKYIYISIPRRTRLVSHEVSKLSTDGVLIGDENDAKNGNLSLVLIWHIIIISSMFLYHVWSIKWLLKLGRVSLRFL